MKGQNTVINLYENTNQLLNASIDKIIVELINKRSDKTKAQIVVLSGCSPLSGTTSTSISLAIAMAATGRKTVLVDCDVRKAKDYKKLNEDVHKGLANYITEDGNDQFNVDEVTYETNIENLLYIPCGETKGNPTRVLCSEKMDTLLQKISENNEYIFLDFPSFSIVPDALIMFSKADGVIFEAALGETKRSQIKDAKKIIEKLGDKYYGLIINKVHKDIFKANVKNYDYYLLDKHGKQHFEKNKAYINKNVKKGGRENAKKK